MKTVAEIVKEIKKGKVFRNVFAQVHFDKSKSAYRHRSMYSGRWTEIDEDHLCMLISEALHCGECDLK
ncbi:hypothetical protein EBB07_29160 [Paenibacillaceae bacterium]|nr:hypothetical protein EBB07_29160 [Paenibacillaceae bacterium]